MLKRDVVADCVGCMRGPVKLGQPPKLYPRRIIHTLCLTRYYGIRRIWLKRQIIFTYR